MALYKIEQRGFLSFRRRLDEGYTRPQDPNEAKEVVARVLRDVGRVDSPKKRERLLTLAMSYMKMWDLDQDPDWMAKYNKQKSAKTSQTESKKRVAPGRYRVFVGAYAGEVDVDHVLFKKGKILSLGDPSDRGVSVELSMRAWVDDDMREAMKGDPDLEDDFLDALARKLGVKRSKVSWLEGAWGRQRHGAQKGWTRGISHKGKVAA